MKGKHEIFEDIWGLLLSRDAAMVEIAFTSLESDQKKAVLNHLKKMVTDPGWQPEQRVSAQVALDTISNHNK